MTNPARKHFTVGEWIMRDGAAAMKRVTLELGGKSPTVLLDDAAIDRTIPAALMLASLRYLETFAKVDGVWLFAERLLHVDWMEECGLA